MITFHNATDTDGHIIHIDEVTKDNRAEHYYCVGCGGEMSAVLGDIREHHFRHKEAHCSWESYLHKLGKMRLKQRFDTQKEFVVKYYVEYHCDKSKGCKLEPIYRSEKCNRRELVALDLKKQFDTCEEEVNFNGFRADLMLSSKEHPERVPIFLEISVTHDCEPEKLASDIQIIELKIADEKDVLRPLVEEDSLFERTNSEHPYDFNALPPIRFFNFKRKFETARPLDRFWVSQDDKGILRGNCIRDNLNCRNVKDNHREDSLYEIAIPSEIVAYKWRLNLYEFGLVKAVLANIGVRHCGICDKYRRCYFRYNKEVEDKMTGEKRIVTKLIWMRQIPDNKMDKVAQASGCRNYYPNLIFVWQVLKKLQGLPCWEWKRE